jgi:Flp pilus assembly protein TadG
MTSLLARWRGKLREFGPAQDGNIAITFAAFSFPMMFFLGWAVDYSIGNSAKASMQAALDATGLSLSKEAQKLNNGEALNAKALKYFLANFNRPDVKNITITPTFTDLDNGKYKLQLSATAQVPTSLTGIWQDYMNIGSETQVIWGYKKLELALALDNTGSMSSNKKMEQLKTAAKNLLDTLKKAAKKDGDIRISIVPFATDVNIGTGNVNADWIRWDEWEADANNFSCSKSQYTTKKNCENNNGQWKLKAKSTWNGCVWDRDQDNDVKNTAVDKNIKSTKFSTHQASSCPVEMLPLTYDWNTLTSKINAMTPTGNTNVTIGMAMAFQTLSPVAPFNASAPAIDLDKVIILLTDGENTESRFSSTAKTIDKRTKLACDNAKAANIKIYTIRVINGNSSLLQQCATKSDMYYDVQDASQLNTVFVTIANSLASLRLAQ